MKLTNTIENTIDNAFFGYDPNEYMPIYEDGELANRSAFIAYKIKRAANHVADGLLKGAEVIDLCLGTAK